MVIACQPFPVVLVLILFLVLADGCTFMSDTDCDGHDLVAYRNASSVLTQAKCCQLCAAHPKCGASIFIPVNADDPSMSDCLIKSACPDPSPLKDRIRCCQPGEENNCLPPKMLNCSLPPLSLYPYCNVSLDVAARVADLLPRLKLKEKIGQMGMHATAVPRLGMVPYNFGGEALHGVWSTCVVDNVSTPTRTASGRIVCPTQFPAPIHMSASFNRQLWHDMADISSTEARGLFNNNNIRYPATAGVGTPCAKSLEGCLGLSFYTPNINIARDPRWGRIEETPGEDPYLNGEYAKEFVAGFQGDGNYMKASVTIKHYVAYNLERDLEGVEPDAWCGSPLNQGGNCSLPNDRHSFNAHVTDLDLRETYAAAFEAGTAGPVAPGAIMCSYNAINGEPACTNAKLIAGLLRDTFGFAGVVATDCGALRDASLHHKRYADPYHTATAAVRAGVDSNCGQIFPKALPSALDPHSGNYTGLTEAELDNSISRLLAARFKLGLFDSGNDVPSWTLADVDTKANRGLALKAARQGIVLLQNSRGNHPINAARLPLSPTGYKKVVMIGPNANASMNLLSGYHGDAPHDLLRSPLDHMRKIWAASNGDVVYSRGCNVSDDQGKTPPAVVEAGIQQALSVAGATDVEVVILGLGLCGDNYGGGPPREDDTCFTITEAEGNDRTNVTLPGAQMELFHRVRALGKPIVVFVMNAGPVDVSEIAASGVPIVAAGYGGEFGGQATAEVLAGIYNPGGALTTTVYTQRYADMTSFHDMTMRGGSAGNPAGRTYRFLEDANHTLSLWQFGHGESYTSFALSFAQEQLQQQDGGSISLDVELVNTGALAGDCVVTCFCSIVSVADADSKNPVPPRSSLFDFTRAELVQPGEKRPLKFTLTARARSLFGFDGERFLPGTGSIYNVQCVGLGEAKTKVRKVQV